MQAQLEAPAAKYPGYASQQHPPPPPSPPPSPSPAPAALPPTPEEVDAEITFYEQAKAAAEAAQEALDGYKQRLIALAELYGHRPSRAEESLRLAGARHTVTVTRGNSIGLNQGAIEELQRWCYRRKIMPVFRQLFQPRLEHKLLEGARTVVKEVALGKRLREKLLQLFSLCIDVKPKAPSVKVEMAKPAKPPKPPKQGGGRKAAA